MTTPSTEALKEDGQEVGASDVAAANKALDIAFRGDTSSIDADMARLFADHRAELIAALEAIERHCDAREMTAVRGMARAAIQKATGAAK